MWRVTPGVRLFLVASFGIGAIVFATMTSPARAEDAIVMKVTLPTINDAPHQFGKNFAAAVEKDSGGRFKGQV